jgi:hypothetical protein
VAGKGYMEEIRSETEQMKVNIILWFLFKIVSEFLRLLNAWSQFDIVF